MSIATYLDYRRSNQTAAVVDINDADAGSGSISADSQRRGEERGRLAERRDERAVYHDLDVIVRAVKPRRLLEKIGIFPR